MLSTSLVSTNLKMATIFIYGKGCPIVNVVILPSSAQDQDQHSPIQKEYVKIYTNCYYSGFYSFLKDKNWANGSNFRFLSKDEEKG